MINFIMAAAFVVTAESYFNDKYIEPLNKQVGAIWYIEKNSGFWNTITTLTMPPNPPTVRLES